VVVVEALCGVQDCCGPNPSLASVSSKIAEIARVGFVRAAILRGANRAKRLELPSGCCLEL